MRSGTRRRVAADDGVSASTIGGRIRQARIRAGFTQQRLAEGRYTKAYISALETGGAKPSIAVLEHISERLGLPASHFLGEAMDRWTRVDADILLASGRWEAAADAYSKLLEVTSDAARRAECLRGLAEAHCRLERGSGAIAPATEAVELFQGLGREQDAMLSMYWLAYAHHLSENAAEARALLTHTLIRIRSNEPAAPDLRVRILMALSSIEAAQGAHRAALAYLEEARTVAGDLDLWRRAALLSMLAYSYTETGDLEAAIRTGVESLGLFRAGEAKHEAAILENNLALAYLGVGNSGRAREHIAHARSRHTLEGDRRSLAHVADTEAQIALAVDEPAAAILLTDEALAHAIASDNHRAQVSALLTRARASRALGDLDVALVAYEGAAAAIREHGPVVRIKEALGEGAEILAGMGRHAEAYELASQALRATDEAAEVEPPTATTGRRRSPERTTG